jgi:hypothetical protein
MRPQQRYPAQTAAAPSTPAPLVPAGRQAAQLREQHRALVRALRPNAVALVDGFGYTDFLLNSALGRKDGNVYQVAAGQHSTAQRGCCGGGGGQGWGVLVVLVYAFMEGGVEGGREGRRSCEWVCGRCCFPCGMEAEACCTRLLCPG